VSSIYPRLPLAVARPLAEERADKSVLDLVSMAETSHPTMRFAPTGGSRVSQEFLTVLQRDVRLRAQACGYPNKYPMQHQAESFDYECAVLLHQSMNLQPAEAAHIEMWAFFTTILLPDVVRWRFGGESTSLERFVGGDRGLRRNTFGRLWWRAYLLQNGDDSGSDAYVLLRLLNEDEIVQITERPSIVLNSRLALAAARSHLACAVNYPHLTRRVLIREAIKRLRRRITIVCYEMLDDSQVQADTDAVFSVAADALTSRLQTSSASDLEELFPDSN